MPKPTVIYRNFDPDWVPTGTTVYLRRGAIEEARLVRRRAEIHIAATLRSEERLAQEETVVHTVPPSGITRHRNLRLR